MKRLVCGWVLFGGMLAAWGQATVKAPASGPATTLVEPPPPLLPTNDRLVVDDAAANVPGDKPEFAAILTESGLKRTETRAVKLPDGGAAGWMRAYRFVDATGAFSAYTYLRQGGRPVLPEVKGTTATRMPDGELILLSGVTVVRAQIHQQSDAVSTLLASIEQGLPKVSGPKGVAPLLPALLPKAGLEVDTVRYALGPVGYRTMNGVLPAEILGWDKSAEAATATYTSKKGNGTLTLLTYPTPQIAGDRGRAIEQAVNQRGAASFGTVKLRRVGPMLAMSSGGFTAEQAEALVGSVRLNEEVTFDKAMPTEFHVEVKKTATLLESIAVFTGVGILAAVVLGVFFGGARAGLRVMQGKPAWVDPEFLRIDLRGRPSPLQPSGSGGKKAD